MKIWMICIVCIIVKLMDWGEDGFARNAETVALRETFQKEVAVWHKLDHANVTKVSFLVNTYLNRRNAILYYHLYFFPYPYFVVLLRDLYSIFISHTKIFIFTFITL